MSLRSTFSMHCYLRGGLSNETEKNNGIYALMSTLLRSGHKFTDEKKLKYDLEDKVASLNNFSGKNAYGLTMHGQSEHFQELSDHFFNSLIYPTFPQKSFIHEKEMTLNSFDRREADPTSMCFDQVNKIFFSNHPYSMFLTGTHDSLQRITLQGVKQIHQNNLKNSEILISYSGSLDFQDIKKKVIQHLEILPERTQQKLKIKPIPYTPVFERHLQFDREQTQIFIGIPTKNLKLKEGIYLRMLSTYLSGQSSELFVDFRDKQGLCYSVQPVHFKALEAGYWGIYMASSFQKVEKAEAAIYKLIEKIRVKGIGKQKFNRLKQMIQGQEEMEIQTNDDYINIYSIPLLQNLGADYHYKSLEEIASMKYEEFSKNISKILSKKFSKVTAGR